MGLQPKGVRGEAWAGLVWIVYMVISGRMDLVDRKAEGEGGVVEVLQGDEIGRDATSLMLVAKKALVGLTILMEGVALCLVEKTLTVYIISVQYAQKPMLGVPQYLLWDGNPGIDCISYNVRRQC